KGFWDNRRIEIGYMIGHKNVRAVALRFLNVNVFMPDEDERKPKIGPHHAAVINKVTAFDFTKQRRKKRPQKNRDHQHHKNRKRIKHVQKMERLQQAAHGSAVFVFSLS